MSRLGERLTMLRINASAPSRAAVGATGSLVVLCTRQWIKTTRGRGRCGEIRSVSNYAASRVVGARRAADYIAERAASTRVRCARN